MRRSSKRFARRFGLWLIVTDGAAGSYASGGTGAWHISAPSVPVVSAVGSGDAYAAGLAAALVEGKEMPDALRRAAACGAANAITPYAGHLEAGALNRLLSQVKVHPLVP